MGTPYLGEIKIVSFNYPPEGWTFCNGQLLPINQNQALFSLLGTMYGGNGQTNFALPNLQARVPLHMGSGFILGQSGGQDAHTLTMSEMPLHMHDLRCATAKGAANDPTGAFPARSLGNLYVTPANLTTFAPASITNVGRSQPHSNQQPYLVLNFIISLVGVFPSRN